MKLFAWYPISHGALSWFVMAESEEEARKYVEAEIARRKSLDSNHPERITDYECRGWGTDQYVFEVADRGVVLCNSND